MKLLIVSGNKDFISQIALKLLPAGVEINSAEHKDEIDSWLKDPSHTLLLFHLEKCKNCLIDYVTKLKQSRPELKIAVYLARTRYNCLKKLLNAGISAFIYKSDIKEAFTTQLMSIIAYFESTGERRAHIRLTPSPEDNGSVVFSHKGIKVDTQVLDISTVALSINPKEKDLFKDYRKKEVIENIELYLNGKRVAFDAIPVFSDRNIVLMYVNVKDDFLKVICSFIYQTLNRKK